MTSERAKRRRQELAAFKRLKDTPIGTPVTVTKDDGSKVDTVTTNEPYMLGGHTPVVGVDGISYCYLITRVALRSLTEKSKP